MSARPLTEKLSTDKLIGVPETMLIPLFARAVETPRPDAICRDPKAVELVSRIDYDFSKFDPGNATALGIAIRTQIFDDMARAYIEQHPECVVINIAAGLDARFYRVDNGKLRWYELDLPEAIELRRQFFSESERHRFLAANALDPIWLEQIEHSKHMLVIIEGLLMYFDESDVKFLLTLLAERLPGCEKLVEVLGKSQAQRTGNNEMVSKTNAAFKWGIRDAAEMGTWHPALDYVTDVSIYDRHDARWRELPLKWPAALSELRNTANRIVHLRSRR
ncbi:MAG: class I SAM-dependent methyltransferase [Gammaproteobacteria bacterium]|nr:class I SAM-dependent methyltransferase [Gammaproteobacteria bacterium]